MTGLAGGVTVLVALLLGVILLLVLIDLLAQFDRCWRIETRFGDGTVRWWNSVLGWVEDESLADAYTDAERAETDLPPGGEWVDIHEVTM